MTAPIARQIVSSTQADERSERRIEREFLSLLDAGAKLVPVGTARKRPRALLRRGYMPRYRIDLFDTTFYLSRVRQNEDIRFFVAYLVQGSRRQIHPRIFYKDVSLVWRSASHFVRSEQENWIGKGDVKVVRQGGEEWVESDEATTDLPLEIQTALESLIRRVSRIPTDHEAVALVLRRGPDDRVEPYRDFSGPRRHAQADRRNLVNGGRSIARFARRRDPTSLRIAKGYEPDFAAGILEVEESKSRLYGGLLRRYRILSRNQQVQYLFFAGPRQVWIGALQATTTELSSYGVRTIDVPADEDLLLPGYEYHFLDDAEDPPVFVSQIPKGFAGPSSEVDPSRADASPWLDRVPVIRQFRRQVLRG